MAEDYCPIKNTRGICSADNSKCNHVRCWEKIHYNKTTEAIERKFQNWREHRRGEIRWESQPAPGGVLHAAGFDEAGNIHVADIWESEQDLNNFVSGQLAPAMQKLNILSNLKQAFQISSKTQHTEYYTAI